jgi:hypothetical protein
MIMMKCSGVGGVWAVRIGHSRRMGRRMDLCVGWSQLDVFKVGSRMHF